MIARLAPRLRRDRRGATIMEFAIVSPVMLLLLMGLSDMLYQQYAQSILTGAVQKAGRASTIQGADTSDVDTKVVTMLHSLLATPTQSSCISGSRKPRPDGGWIWATRVAKPYA